MAIPSSALKAMPAAPPGPPSAAQPPGGSSARQYTDGSSGGGGDSGGAAGPASQAPKPGSYSAQHQARLLGGSGATPSKPDGPSAAARAAPPPPPFAISSAFLTNTAAMPERRSVSEGGAGVPDPHGQHQRGAHTAAGGPWSHQPPSGPSPFGGGHFAPATPMELLFPTNLPEGGGTGEGGGGRGMWQHEGGRGLWTGSDSGQGSAAQDLHRGSSLQLPPASSLGEGGAMNSWAMALHGAWGRV